MRRSHGRVDDARTRGDATKQCPRASARPAAEDTHLVVVVWQTIPLRVIGVGRLGLRRRVGVGLRRPRAKAFARARPFRTALSARARAREGRAKGARGARKGNARARAFLKGRIPTCFPWLWRGGSDMPAQPGRESENYCQSVAGVRSSALHFSGPQFGMRTQFGIRRAPRAPRARPATRRRRPVRLSRSASALWSLCAASPAPLCGRVGPLLSGPFAKTRDDFEKLVRANFLVLLVPT